MNGMNFQQVVDLTVTINGNDRVINNIPLNVEIAAMGNETFSGSREAMLQAVDSMLQTSKKALEQISWHKNTIVEAEKMLEVLNPRYAEEKKQARTINDLEKRQAATDAKLDSILSILKKLDSPS
jgi:small-conductance mechanosensitive channel